MQTRQKEINTKELTFYSQKAIGIATFIGGPIAAGYLIRENYKALDQTEKGNKALIISIVAMITVLALIFSIPEHIIEKIPKVVIPAIYTGAIYLIVEKIFGAIFKQHEENEYAFFSRWRAAGIGFISLLVLVVCLFGYDYATTDFEMQDSYNTKIDQFVKNENESLAFYSHMDTESSFSLILELNDKVIPAWKENIVLIKEANTIEGLPDDLVVQNKKLIRYAELRLEAFELFKKSLSEDTNKYDAQLTALHDQIDEQLKLLN
ncbi:hypothetical protein H2O64_02425 [Kordia sp. YSTF-M3]|uniref:Uncharacterized protein n=1 Tax=Kordia aestuariivivens TaxID=2759037 RepID=A0ABR7Q4L8_9FLAO|nr:hypothetical protein [Kordia aestuariivivens]MBC8753509.1 hypothetical protein [Kordia aestuariivivens]